jgi:hypothetical protein
VPEFLEGLDDGVFVLGKDLSKPSAFSTFFAASKRDPALGDVAPKEISSQLFMRAHAQLPGDLGSDRSTVAGCLLTLTP